MDTYRRHLERHRYHISQLETIMRLVDNDALPISQVSALACFSSGFISMRCHVLVQVGCGNHLLQWRALAGVLPRR